MSKQKWEVKSHNHQIADTGDYDGHYELTNGKVSIFTKDESDDDFKGIIDVLNESEIYFYLDDADKWLAHHYKQEMEKGDREIEKLRAENSKMRKALEMIRDGFDHENDAHKYQNLGACPVCITTEALKNTAL